MLALGADTDELRTFSGVLGDAAQRLEDVVTALAADGEQIPWVGPDADSFRAELEKVCLQGSDVAQQVRARGLRLEQEADEQEVASSTDGFLAHGPGTWNIPHLRGPWKLPHGPVPSWPVPMPEGMGADPLDALDTASDVLRQFKSIRHQDIVESMLGSGGKRLLKFLPIFGAAPDALEAGQALGDGDTGGVIGNMYEIALGLTPHPITTGISLANDIGELVLPGDSSPLELFGGIAAHGDRVRMGEMTGSVISDQLGYEDGSLPDNVLTAGLGTLGHLSALRPQNIGAESASAARNWVYEQR